MELNLLILNFLYINSTVKNITAAVSLEHCLIVSPLVFPYNANTGNF